MGGGGSSNVKRRQLKLDNYLAKLTPSEYLGPHKVSGQATVEDWNALGLSLFRRNLPPRSLSNIFRLIFFSSNYV